MSSLTCLQAMFSRSGRLRNRSLNRLLHDRKIDQRRKHAEQDREPPDRRVGPVCLEHDAAELRLKAAETNLTRVEDVIGQLAGQMEGLKKQARQAVRYREVAAKV
ncbi:MAG: hypothetical protein JSV48_06060, partial [Bradyrhizobium sp.]